MPYKTFDKASLLAVLQKRCPTALSKFPDPSTFEIETKLEGSLRLCVGRLYKKVKSSKLWVTPDFRFDFIDIENNYYNTRDYSLTMISGIEVFHELSKPSDGDIDALKPGKKALVEFIFVLCGYKKRFVERDLVEKRYDGRVERLTMSSLVNAMKAWERYYDKSKEAREEKERRRKEWEEDEDYAEHGAGAHDQDDSHATNKETPDIGHGYTEGDTSSTQAATIDSCITACTSSNTVNKRALDTEDAQPIPSKKPRSTLAPNDTDTSSTLPRSTRALTLDDKDDDCAPTKQSRSTYCLPPWLGKL